MEPSLEQNGAKNEPRQQAASRPPEAILVSSTARDGAEQLLLSSQGYRLLRRLGCGSFGEVWRAEAPGGVEVAVKIITRPLDHKTAQKELQSLELIKRLRHPYLLSTQAYWSQQDRLYIVMELADCTLT